MEKIHGYTIIKKIDETLDAKVYRARCEDEEQTVIIKVLRAGHPSLSDIAGFRQEFEFINKHIDSDGVVHTYELLEDTGRLALVLEDFNGVPLDRVFQDHPVAVDMFLEIALKLSETLGNLHKNNIVHLGLKPHNILINEERRQVKITDFGVAAYLTRVNGEFSHASKLAYVSPEQTGRINRQMDYRSDFYSLGVIFYELLTGMLPFMSDDPMAMIHAHIARKPAPLHLFNPEVPEVVSNIVLKLMSKTAEERYQSGFGLKADLQYCLESLNAQNKVLPFELGRKDISLMFNMSGKLYGREEAFDRLLTGFYDASAGRPCIMLVSGYPGIGKTALINKAQNPFMEKQGIFISGKYDQVGRDVPYSAIIQAFQGLIKQLLCESPERVGEWKKKLLNALSPNEAIIAQMIPDIVHVMGVQQKITDLGSEEFKNRFMLVFKNFIKVFAQEAHPLVLFLDDIQWADMSSLQLLRSFITDPELKYIYVITCFRKGDDADMHPFMKVLDDVRKSNVRVCETVLMPLKVSHVNDLIQDFLRCPESRSRQLAELVHKKTGGNPFFINQFMKMLYDRNMLQPNPESGWQWDLEQIRQLQLTDNVVVLLSDKIVQLGEGMREVLTVGACIGHEFNLELLAAVIDKPMEVIWGDVKNAINEGYIEIQGDMIRFQHDRVWEAAYSLISKEEQNKIHYLIGLYVLEKADKEDLAGHVFFIVDHLNQAKGLVVLEEEREVLARLNLLAGEKAIQSAAYASALTYLEHGISLLDKDAWTVRYDFSLKLYERAVAAACLGARFQVMERLCAVALKKTDQLTDQVTLYEYQILACIAQNDLVGAVNIGLNFLSRLDIIFPKKPNIMHVIWKLIRINLALRRRSVASLLDLPEMTDPKILSAMRIIAKISTPAYNSNLILSVLIEFEHLLLSIKYGNTPGSAVAYSAYGLHLCVMTENFEKGYKFGLLALNLLDKMNNNEFKAQVITTFYGFIKPWKDPSKESLPYFLEGFQLGREAGTLAYSAYCAFMYCGSALVSGRELCVLDEEITKYRQAIDQMNQKHPLMYINIVKQVVLNLRGYADDPGCLSGDAYDENEMLPIHQKREDQSALAYVSCNKMVLNYLFGNLTRAKESAVMMAEYINGTRGSLDDVRFYLFSSLIDLALYPKASKHEKKRILREIGKSRKKLRKYAHYSPRNTEFAYYLVAAEHAGVLGMYEKAVVDYDNALNAAMESGFINYEAMVNELRAKFYLANNQDSLAGFYMREARRCYDCWGALAKVRHLDTLYPELLTDAGGSANHDISGFNRTELTLMTHESAPNFDVSTVMKASEAIFGEIVLSKLLKRLMAILIENAGAEKGFVILKEQDVFLVEAEGNIASEEINVLTSVPIDHHPGVSSAIVNYVARTKETVILHDAGSQGGFVRDPYVIKNRPKSILCMPILNQGRLSAILYLENNLSTNTFTPQRLGILNMLSSQIAVSIDNARLYDNLEQKVEERTIQLKLAQAENLKKAHRAGMADIAKETLHNMGNILNSIITIAETVNKNKQHTALSGLTSANSILRKHMDDLHDFILNDPKADRLMHHYLTLENIFNEEQENIDRQLQRLRKKVDEIVKVFQALQDHISFDDTFFEYVHLKEEIAFLLATKRDSLRQSHITVDERYENVPRVRVQKAKLAYILDNLIINAKEALDSVPTDEKRISVEVAQKNGSVLLHIGDNGEGIPGDRIEKIFFHGFSTKEGRLGHNLHNCANNMMEMGGKIQVESKGKGRGAVFTLEFPIVNVLP